MDAWTPKAKDTKGYVRECYEAAANWHSLSSFFESQGYYLYDYPSVREGATPPKNPSPSATIGTNPDPYPYARRFTSEENQLAFVFVTSMRVWPARDSQGREVIFRLVAGPEGSDELDVYRRLNMPLARQDHRNHTVPVLDWLTYDGLTFVVMPRWDIIALARSEILFRDVSELLGVAETLFEGLVFLHEKRIAHRDICETNIVMNALVDPDDHYYALREPTTVRYAYIDYDRSLILPEDTDISKVSVPRRMTLQNCHMRIKPGECNPFTDDVRALAYTLERSIRHIEDEVPEIGQFFERLIRGPEGAIPPAAVALADLRSIRSRLNDSQLRYEPIGQFWYPDHIKLLRDDPDGSTLTCPWFSSHGKIDRTRVSGTISFFRNVSELLDVADTLFEGPGFLHEKRIARRGVFEMNIVMNALVHEDTDISKVTVSRLKAARNGYMGLKLGPCNPFLDDVRALGHTLQRSIRHVEDKIPEIGAFFDRVVVHDQRLHRIAGVSRLARSTPSSGSLPTRVRADGTVLGAKPYHVVER
ncbi:hypothetical protein NMY22_g17308 [Coprinellus aureogranulatus]|nr:hypothetical protein NMY22_g17308 [Coprinellus aureogranulatus]